MWFCIKRELIALKNDPWQIALVSFIPIIGMLVFWWIFSASIARDMPVAMIDHDHSSISRILSRKLDANSGINLLSFDNINAAKKAISAGQVYAIVTFPNDLKKDLLTGKRPTVDIRYNSQFLLVGKLLSSQIQLSLADGLTHVGELKQWLKGVPKGQAAINVKPIASQITPLYNSNNNYLVFLLSPMLIAFGQIMAMLIFSNALARELRLNTIKEMFALGVWRVIASKFLIYIFLLLIQSFICIAFLYDYLAMPLAGNIIQMLFGLLLMLLAVFLMVLLLFFKLQDPTRMVSFGTALFAPAFAFMGVTFPVSQMPIAAQIWRLMMPSSHYIDTHMGVMSYNQSWLVFWQQATSYWGYLFLIPLIWLLAKKLNSSLNSVSLNSNAETKAQDSEVQV